MEGETGGENKYSVLLTAPAFNFNLIFEFGTKCLKLHSQNQERP